MRITLILLIKNIIKQSKLRAVSEYSSLLICYQYSSRQVVINITKLIDDYKSYRTLKTEGYSFKIVIADYHRRVGQ